MDEMDFYDGAYTGEQIDEAISAVRNPDSAPDATHTGNLISSAAVAASEAALGGGMAILATGNTHSAITKDQYVYVRLHSTLADGLYQATANIAANGTLSSSNLAAVSGGGLNALKSALIQVELTYSAADSAFPVSVAPRNNAAIVVPTRNNTTGAVYILWYRAASNGFRVGTVLSGDSPSDGDKCVVQYFI